MRQRNTGISHNSVVICERSVRSAIGGRNCSRYDVTQEEGVVSVMKQAPGDKRNMAHTASWFVEDSALMCKSLNT